MKSRAITAIFKLVIAEYRGSWQRLSYFMICIAVGVGSVMCVKSFAENIVNSIEEESKMLIASDLEIRGSWPLTNEEFKKVKQIAERDILIQTVVEMKSMVFIEAALDRASSSTLVELKAVPENYPYYGQVETTPKIPFQKLLQGDNALVEESFLLKNNLRIGDSFRLGESNLRVSGVIKREPDRAINFFNLGPRVIISSETLKKTNLIQKGSRVRYRTQIKIPPQIELEPFAKKLKNSLANTGFSVRSHLQARPALRESIRRYESFLGSIGVIALLVGGVGVAMITRSFLDQKLKNIAILKCLGAQTYKIFSIYLIQALLLGLAGSLLGIACGFCLQWLSPAWLNKHLNLSISLQWIWKPALVSLALGMLTTFIFSLWPLLKARRVPPASLLRYGNNGMGPSNYRELKNNKWPLKIQTFIPKDIDQWIAIGALVFGLMIITFWQAKTLKDGFIFFSGVSGAAIILIFLSRTILEILKRLPGPKNITFRYGLSNLFRGEGHTITIATTLGVGVMLILSVQLIQSDLLDFINTSGPVNAPNFFFVDIQQDQVKPFKKIIKKNSSARLTELVPIIRSRLHAVDGRPVGKMKFASARTKKFFNREFVLTFTDALPKENIVVDGKWWGKSIKNYPRVSVEVDAAKTLGVSLGSQLTLNIQGVPITATVASLRKVNWNNRRTNFYMIFSPDSLEKVYYNFVATAQVPKKEELKLQTAITQSLPNITAINTSQILAQVQEVLNRLSFLVRILSIFAITTGFVILSGAIASTKFRRLREVAILKAVGATKKNISGILSYEYIILGLMAGGMGSFLSVLFSYGMDKYLVRLDWNLRPVPVVIAVVITIFLTWAVGLFSSRNILNNKPLQTLRAHE